MKGNKRRQLGEQQDGTKAAASGNQLLNGWERVAAEHNVRKNLKADTGVLEGPFQEY